MDYIEVAIPEHPITDHIRSNFTLDFDKGPWVAGGICRRLLCDQFHNGNDIDVFYPPKNSIDARRSGYSDKIFIGNLYIREQLIYDKRFDTWENLLNDFDFTVCQFATDGKTIRGPAQAFEDLKNWRLHIRKETTPIHRLVRYIVSGYMPDMSVIQAFEKLYQEKDKFSASMENTYYSLANITHTHIPLNSKDYSEGSFLGSIGDIHIESIDNQPIIFVGQHPFPFQMGFSYIFDQSNTFYKSAMRTEWEKIGLNNDVVKVSDEHKETFIRVLKQFISAGQ